MNRLKYAILLLSAFGSNISFGQKQDSVVALIAPEYDKVSKLHRFFLGDSYRKLYNTPVKMPLIDLSAENGGMEVVKLGGGMQTQSLRLKDANGREWALRSIQKYPERSLPESLRNTFAKDIVQDQISIAHPFGALTVPVFNEALGIPHASPRLVYAGDDPVFGEFREIFKNRAYMFEPRTPFEDVKSDNTDKVIRKLLADNDVSVDQKLTLKARLLDFILGDWDRHEDNWRWNPVKNDGETRYQPIPRDRDKVFYKTSGVFPVLLSYQYLKANVQPFGPKIRNVSEWNFNARHFDRLFLNELSLKDWKKEVTHIQEIITDDLIQNAMSQMPDTIVKLSADELIQNIQIRKDSLLSTATAYYLSLSKNVDIPLSEKREFVDLHIRNDQSVQIHVSNKKKDGTKGRTLYKRTFHPDETQEIRIYGIGGEDEYRINAESNSSIKIRLIGGNDFDKYDIENPSVSKQNIYVYDQKSKVQNSFNLNNKVKYRLSDDSLINAYDYNAFVYNRKGVVLDLNYGVDRGLILGLGYLIQNQGFRKEPYAYSHSLMGHYLTGRNSFMFEYEGIYKKFWNKNDLKIELSSLGPRNLSNFFGYGNATEFIKEDDDINDIEYGIGYYRNRYDLVSGNIYLKKELSKSLNYYYGSSNELYTSTSKFNKDHFLTDFKVEHPQEFVFGTKFFTGASFGVEFDNRDRKDLPQSGLYFATDWGWKHEIGKGSNQFLKSSNVFSVYKTILNNRLTLANRVGSDIVWGSPYFYQHTQLGGEGSLRGYNSKRFTGKSSLYNNFDLRLKVWELNSYILPATFGAIGFYDVGRVWMTGEQSNKWHNGYGGGIYISPANLFIFQAVIGVSKEAVLPYLRLGMSF